jgi:hypothetical protein
MPAMQVLRLNARRGRARKSPINAETMLKLARELLSQYGGSRSNQ